MGQRRCICKRASGQTLEADLRRTNTGLVARTASARSGWGSTRSRACRSSDGACSVTLIAASTLASYIPAARATAVEPIHVLRAE